MTQVIDFTTGKPKDTDTGEPEKSRVDQIMEQLNKDTFSDIIVIGYTDVENSDAQKLAVYSSIQGLVPVVGSLEFVKATLLRGAM